MKIKSTPHKIILLLAGLISTAIGLAMLCVPVIFHASGGIELAENINLLSEMRSQGGVTLGLSDN